MNINCNIYIFTYTSVTNKIFLYNKKKHNDQQIKKKSEQLSIDIEKK